MPSFCFDVAVPGTFDEMEQMGWIDSRRPRMITVQAAGCAPIVRAFEQNQVRAQEWLRVSTLAAGLRVPKAIGDFMILNILRRKPRLRSGRNR